MDDDDNDGATVDGWFRTGDEAQIVDGRLRITGRLKDVVSRNGKKMSLAEVDQAFTAASGITECAAFGVPDADTGERVAVAVHLDDDITIDVPERARGDGGGRPGALEVARVGRAHRAAAGHLDRQGPAPRPHRRCRRRLAGGPARERPALNGQ